jgi:hypothetical protein
MSLVVDELELLRIDLEQSACMVSKNELKLNDIWILRPDC